MAKLTFRSKLKVDLGKDRHEWRVGYSKGGIKCSMVMIIAEHYALTNGYFIDVILKI